jgi:hypothetical protein
MVPTMIPARPPLSRLFAGPFPALEQALLSRLGEASWGGPSWERVLLVPSNELREHLLKRVASVREGAAAGASAMTLYDFALRLLGHRGMFPGELPPVRMAAAVLGGVREAYGAGGGDFAGIAGTPGFPSAVARTFADLEEGWVGDRELALAERACRGGRNGGASPMPWSGRSGKWEGRRAGRSSGRRWRGSNSPAIRSA